MSTEVCTCGAPVRLDESTMRLGAQTVGCRRCNYTGKPEYRITREVLIESITNKRPNKGAK
jgi:hypothetical protein